MNTEWLAFPWFSGLIAVGWAAALATRYSSGVATARRITIGIASIFLVSGCLWAAMFYSQSHVKMWIDPIRWPGNGAEPLLALDALNAVLLPFVAVLAFAALWGSTRASLTPARMGIILRQLCALWLMLLSVDFVVLLIAWMIGLVPLIPSGRAAAKRHHAIPYMAMSTMLFTLAIVGMVHAGVQAGVAQPTSLLYAKDIEAHMAPWILPVLMVALLIRKGIFPFHGWIPALAEAHDTTTVALLTSNHMSLFLLFRLGLMLFPHASLQAMPWIAQTALAAALYGSVVGLGASSLRRAYGWMVVSQSALALVGLECANASGITGALVFCLALGMSLMGLGLAIGMVESRIHLVDLNQWYGLSQHAPRLATCFLLLGMASVGLPGTLGYVAEDLITHGTLDAYPWTGIAMILATAANGFNVLRCFFHVFGGPAPHGRYVLDMQIREKVAIFSLLLSLIGLGLFPSAVVGTRAKVADTAIQGFGRSMVP